MTRRSETSELVNERLRYISSGGRRGGFVVFIFLDPDKASSALLKKREAASRLVEKNVRTRPAIGQAPEDVRWLEVY